MPTTYNGAHIDHDGIKEFMKNPAPFNAGLMLVPGSGYPKDSGSEQLPLSFMTNAFYRMREADEKRHAQVITTVDFFEKPVELTQLRTLLRKSVSPLQRFRSIITCDGPSSSLLGKLNPFRGPRGQFYWKEVPVDFGYHVVEEVLPEPADESALYEFMGRSFAFEMDPNRPRWKFYVFNNYKGPQGKCALVSRISHEIGDGATLVQVMFSLFEKLTLGSSLSPVGGSSPNSASPTTVAMRGPKLTGVRRLRVVLSRLTDPFVWLEVVGLYLTSALNGFFELLFRDSSTYFKLKTADQIHSERLVYFSKRIPLSVIQSIRPIVKGTVNDVLTAAVAGALRRFLQKREDPAVRRGRLLIRALVPFNLRREGQWDLVKNPKLFGNRFTLLPLALPVNAEHPFTLLKEGKRLCDDLKEGLEATILVGMNKLAAKILPAKVYVWLSHFTVNQTTLLFTNVMGPKEPVALEGNRLTDVGFFVPCPFGINVSIFSYCGNITFGVLTCPSLENVNPKDICECFEEEMEILKNYAEAYARTPQDPPVPRRHPKVPRHLAAQLLALLGTALLVMPKDWAVAGLPVSHALYAAVVLKLWRQSPAQIA